MTGQRFLSPVSNYYIDRMKQHFNHIIVGGGIVGASTAMQLKQRNPKARVLLIEKENGPAQHQTGHNSGVVHAGVYYTPGSLKADFCKRGLAATQQFCSTHNIPYDNCGKLIVATHEHELRKLTDLYTNCQTNGLNVSWVENEQLATIEPNIRGIRAFIVKDSAITDYPAITKKMISEFKRMGGQVQYNSAVINLVETDAEVIVTLKDGKTVSTNFLVACAGLQADRIAKLIGLNPGFQIIPFKGEYFKLSSSHSNSVKHLIYPVPDPNMPFLGVHLTNMIDGSVTVGPNAVLGFAREGYSKLSFSVLDTVKMLLFVGFWRVIKSHFSSGVREMKNSLWKPGYLRLVQRYCPTINLKDLEPYPPGIRAQAVLKNGDLVTDFLFLSSKRSLHVCNAPSPAATSAIPIGEYIVDRVITQLGPNSPS